MNEVRRAPAHVDPDDRHPLPNPPQVRHTKVSKKSSLCCAARGAGAVAGGCPAYRFGSPTHWPTNQVPLELSTPLPPFLLSSGSCYEGRGLLWYQWWQQQWGRERQVENHVGWKKGRGVGGSDSMTRATSLHAALIGIHNNVLLQSPLHQVLLRARSSLLEVLQGFELEIAPPTAKRRRWVITLSISSSSSTTTSALLPALKHHAGSS